jgi:hypothetical protein
MKVFHRALVALALVVSVTLFAPAAPAQAGPPNGAILCYGVDEYGRIVFFPCYELALEPLYQKPLPWEPECLSCPPFIDLRSQLGVQDQVRFLDQFNYGLRLLGQAGAAEDPNLRQKLRWEATGIIFDSVKVLGGSEVALATAGYVDLKSGRVYQHQAMVPVGVDLMEGIRLVQRAAGDPTPQPSLEAGMARLNHALEALVALRSW